MVAHTIISIAVWPLVFWLPGAAVTSLLRPRLEEAGPRTAVALLLSPAVVALWMWLGAVLGIPLTVSWGAALVAVSSGVLGWQQYRRRRENDARPLELPWALLVVLAWSLLVTVVVPLRGVAGGMRWNDAFHTLLAQQIVDLGRIPFTMPRFMPGYELTYPPSFHFVVATWHFLSGAPVRLLVPRTSGVLGALTAVGAYAIGHRVAGKSAAFWAGIIAATFVSAGIAHGYFYGTGPMVGSMSLLPLVVLGSIDPSKRRGLPLTMVAAFATVLFYPFSALPTGIWAIALAVSSFTPRVSLTEISLKRHAAILGLTAVVAVQTALYLFSAPAAQGPPAAGTEPGSIATSVGWLIDRPAAIFKFKTFSEPLLDGIAAGLEGRMPADADLAFMTRRDEGDLTYYKLGYTLPRTRRYRFMYEPEITDVTARRALERAKAEWLLVIDDRAALDGIFGRTNTADSALLHMNGKGFEVSATY